jgi:hypothetical protein
MDQNYGTPYPPIEEPYAPPPKKRNMTLIIIVVVLIVLCCCCSTGGLSSWLLWENGDEWFGITSLLTLLAL